MSDMVLSGSLKTIQRKAHAVLAVVRQRSAVGWSIFQADEEWIYRTVGDARVCPFCRGFEDDNPWRGSEIPHFFPRLFYEGAGADLIVRPNVHENPELRFLRGQCRCTLKMIHVAETMERRLHEEKLKVII